MKKSLIVLVFLASFCLVYSQDYDLIVKTSGDSIACHIDSISNTHIYFQMKFKGKWTHTYINKEDVKEYKQEAITKKTTKFQSGSTHIVPNSPDRYTGGKNVLYGTVGFLGVWAVVNGNYERMIMVRNDKFINSLWFRIGGGAYAGWDVSGPTMVTGLTLLTGKKNSHIELNLGIASLFDKSGYESGVSNANYFGEQEPPRADYIDISPAGGLGYRFQKPDGVFVFRTGFSFPETAYISFGLHF